MRLTILLLTFISMVVLSGIQNNVNASLQDSSISFTKPIKWPKSWDKYVGKHVTVEGIALDSKSGAVVSSGKGPDIFIDGLENWPDGFYLGQRKGKKVLVTGLVVVRNVLPAFVDEKYGPRKTGIPVEKESDVAAAEKKYLLQDAKWMLQEK